jgi:hypothetical protein
MWWDLYPTGSFQGICLTIEKMTFIVEDPDLTEAM